MQPIVTTFPEEKQLTLIVQAPLSTKSDLSLERVVGAVDPLLEDQKRVTGTRFEGFEVLADGHLVLARLRELLEGDHGKKYHSRMDRLVLEKRERSVKCGRSGRSGPVEAMGSCVGRVTKAGSLLADTKAWLSLTKLKLDKGTKG